MLYLGLAIAVVAVLLAQIPGVIQQWQENRRDVFKTLWMTGIYLAYLAIGLGLYAAVLDAEEATGVRAFLAVGFVLAWIFYGALPLLRHVPHRREPPRWLLQPGALDAALLAAILVCILSYAWMSAG